MEMHATDVAAFVMCYMHQKLRNYPLLHIGYVTNYPSTEFEFSLGASDCLVKGQVDITFVYEGPYTKVFFVHCTMFAAGERGGFCWTLGGRFDTHSLDSDLHGMIETIEEFRFKHKETQPIEIVIA
jgi:hypothetical protein